MREIATARPKPRHALDMDEVAFLGFARQRLATSRLAIFLDSSGPVHDHACEAWLCDAPLACFEDWGSECALIIGSRVEWFDRSQLEARLEGCRIQGHYLFSLLCYEAFLPQRVNDHPVWRGPHALWLVCSGPWRFDRRAGRLSGPLESEPCPGRTWLESDQPVVALGWRDQRRDYLRKIESIKDDIYEGAYYQANLSQRCLTRTDRDPLDTYFDLRARNPSAYMGVLRRGDQWVLSGSPELLVQRRGNQLTARPIAGTKPRFRDRAADRASVVDLVTSQKERAEHIMLVDLVRNDLGRLARAGTVRVEELAAVESYSHVHHLVSQVVAEQARTLGILELLRAVFPGGTITGAPKIACMRRLAELELESRGPYTGALGVVTPDGDTTFNILIRTLVQHGSLVCFHGGGGIVADSEPNPEFDETIYKVQALMEALGMTPWERDVATPQVGHSNHDPVVSNKTMRRG